MYFAYFDSYSVIIFDIVSHHFFLIILDSKMKIRIQLGQTDLPWHSSKIGDKIKQMGDTDKEGTIRRGSGMLQGE